MQNFEVKDVGEITKGKYRIGAKRLLPKEGKKVTINDIRTLTRALIDKKDIDRNRISILVKTIDNRYLTIKSFADNDIRDWDDIEYMKNKVKDDKKFYEYEYVDFYVKNNNNNNIKKNIK